MTEYDKFVSTLADRPINTQRTYLRQYKKLREKLDKDINDASQKLIIEVAMKENKLSGSQALINIGVLVRNMNNKPNNELDKQRKSNAKGILHEIKGSNVKLQETLPTLKDLEDFMNFLWDESNWTDFIINYLLINYGVRNADLNFEIITRKKDATDPNTNYMWVSPKKCTYIRRDYKTVGTHGEKRHIINDVKFLTAMRRVIGCRKSNLKCGVFIPEESQIGYYIKKATYKGLGETAYMKILVNAYRNNLTKLRELANSRGTSLDLISTTYNIDNV